MCREKWIIDVYAPILTNGECKMGNNVSVNICGNAVDVADRIVYITHRVERYFLIFE